MQEFARLPDSERLEIFRECANRRGIRELIIEKDFWVCWVIEQLFSLKELSGYFTFKGGTSLSKAYGLIERFSEDIDLTIDRRAQLLCDVPNPIETDISGNERKRRIASLKVATQQFLVDVILPTLTQAIHTSIQNINSWNLKLDQQDRELQTLVFEYPQIVDLGSGYIRPSIRLEFGARGAISPVEKRSISSYAALDFPKYSKEI